jgi:hypothetical protein
MRKANERPPVPDGLKRHCPSPDRFGFPTAFHVAGYSDAVKAVAWFLHDAGPGSECCRWDSVETIANGTKYKPRTVQVALKTLREDGWIAETEWRNPQGYLVTVRWLLWNLSPEPPELRSRPEPVLRPRLATPERPAAARPATLFRADSCAKTEVSSPPIRADSCAEFAPIPARRNIISENCIQGRENVTLRARHDGSISGGTGDGPTSPIANPSSPIPEQPPASVPTPPADRHKQREEELAARWPALPDDERAEIAAAVKAATPRLADPRFKSGLEAACLAELEAHPRYRDLYPPIAAAPATEARAAPAGGPLSIADRVAAFVPTTPSAERLEVAREIAGLLADWEYFPLTNKLIQAAGADPPPGCRRVPAAAVGGLLRKALRSPFERQALAWGKGGKQILRANGHHVGNSEPYGGGRT